MQRALEGRGGWLTPMHVAVDGAESAVSERRGRHIGLQVARLFQSGLEAPLGIGKTAFAGEAIRRGDGMEPRAPVLRLCGDRPGCCRQPDGSECSFRDHESSKNKKAAAGADDCPCDGLRELRSANV